MQGLLLKLHCARHTWATFALYARRNFHWVADRLGHADLALTLRVYAHALREEETDLSFLDLGGTRRHPRGTEGKRAVASKKSLRATPRRNRRILERKTGLEPARPKT